ncbi:MAG: hypothetical protein ACRDSH_11150, partial [Pseudonocardiaceae bacterium]
RFGYPPQLYVQLTNTLYFWFGTLGAAVYVGSIGAAAALTWMVRRCGRTVVALTGTASVLQLVALVTWLTLIALVNARLRAVAPGEVPDGFPSLRAQWEYTHLLGFVLFTMAFLLLVVSLVAGDRAISWGRAGCTDAGEHPMRRLLIELGVLGTLLVSLLTIPLAVPHAVTGTVWMALTAAHVARRRRIYRALARSGRRRRVAASTALIGSAVLVVVSGFVQWAGPDSVSAAAIPWHAGSSMVLILLAVTHAARRLRRIRRPRTAVDRYDYESSMVDVS